jgi:hypothetical protein
LNVETLRKRVEDITQEMFNCRATYSKLDGHLQEANHWLASLLAAEDAQTETPAEEEIPAGNEEEIPMEHE